MRETDGFIPNARQNAGLENNLNILRHRPAIMTSSETGMKDGSRIQHGHSRLTDEGKPPGREH